MLPIDDLLVSQEVVDIQKIQTMKEFVLRGGIWKTEVYERSAYILHGAEGISSPLIAITRFEDGTLLIQNGHHRCRATREVREFLYEDEYLISDRIVRGYEEINFSRGFVTPFDPKTEIRLADFSAFKAKVLELSKTDPDAAAEYVMQNPHLYKRPRTILRVMELRLENIPRKNF